jgi:hypothetical protein
VYSPVLVIVPDQADPFTTPSTDQLTALALDVNCWVCSKVRVAVLGVTENAPIVSVRVALPVPKLLAALSVTVELPAAVGVPEIAPVVVFTDNPPGNPVAP